MFVEYVFGDEACQMTDPAPGAPDMRLQDWELMEALARKLEAETA